MHRIAIHKLPNRALALCALLFSSQLTASAIQLPPPAPLTISAVRVGDAGNPNDPLTRDTYGGVAYAFNIGTTEVTNAQYAAFLNQKAKSDPLGLYNDLMSSSAYGGITRTGASGSFAYTTRENMGNKPVNFVSWYDSIRFANWLNNGQGVGDTETGAYTILGGTATPSNAFSITRNSGATWFLTSENEWYKAAYYQPAAQGGDTDGYWRYSTRSNAVPTVATANSTGDISNPGENVANYNNGADWNALDGNLTTVASAGPLSASFYGTSDQGGNVFEWNESVLGSSRGIRGGTFGQSSNNLQSTIPGGSNPANEAMGIGFRVATVAVPEPATSAMAIVGGLLMLLCTRRRK